MVYLADCPVELINIGQGDHNKGEGIPVNKSSREERIFMIVCGC